MEEVPDDLLAGHKRNFGKLQAYRGPTQNLTLAGIRNAMHTEEGILQLIQTLKDNGCTAPDQRIADMLQFIMNFVDIQMRGPNVPTIPKRELCQVLEFVYPNPGDKVVYRPGKSFTAVMKSLLRTIGAPDSVINAFSGTKRHYKYLAWTPEGQQKLAQAMAFAEQGGVLGHHLDDDDDDDEKKGLNASKVVAAYKSTQAKYLHRARRHFIPRYDVLFSRNTWSYYIRVFMPMCEPTSLQQGIKLDMYKGMINIRGRYSVTPTLPPWTTQGEPVGDLDVIQPLPSSACGEFTLEIPLPFDVDRTSRQEVHVTDIGIIISVKRLKEDVPQMEFKVHTFADSGAVPHGHGHPHALPQHSPHAQIQHQSAHMPQHPGVQVPQVLNVPVNVNVHMPQHHSAHPGHLQVGHQVTQQQVAAMQRR